MRIEAISEEVGAIVFTTRVLLVVQYCTTSTNSTNSSTSSTVLVLHDIVCHLLLLVVLENVTAS